jgi:hypothetical protein
VEERDVGYICVAKQLAPEHIRFRINQILTFADRIANFLIQRSILPHEKELWELFGKVNNMPSIGSSGKWSNIQLNHSTGTTNLGEAIGKVQGGIHPDPNDSVISYTCFLLFVQYPKGMFSLVFLASFQPVLPSGTKLNAGAFLFMQTGAYVQDDQVSTILPNCPNPQMEICLFAVIFKGNEPHSGFAPILHPDENPILTTCHQLLDQNSEIYNWEIVD